MAGCDRDRDDDPIMNPATEITWELSTDGTLTLSGKGDMPDYEYYECFILGAAGGGDIPSGDCPKPSLLPGFH
jgi:hypothetical protein